MKARTIVTLAVAVSLAGGGYLLAYQRGKRIENEVHRQREAALAEVGGLQAASRDREGVLRYAVDRNKLLTQAVEDLELTLADLGAKDPEVREVIRWRTPDIEVPAAVVCPDVAEPGPAPAPRPAPFAFRVEGAEARLITELGNIFATGTVELWRTRPPPETILGETIWRTDVTELMVTPESVPQEVRRWALGLGWTGGQYQGVTAMASRDLFKRWRIQAGAGWMQNEATKTVNLFLDDYPTGSQDINVDGSGWTFQLAGFWRL